MPPSVGYARPDPGFGERIGAMKDDKPSSPARADSEGKSPGEDAAIVLALLACSAFGLTIATLLVLEFIAFLPKGIDTIAFVCIAALFLVIGRALLERILSLPAVYRGEVPIVRHRRV